MSNDTFNCFAQQRLSYLVVSTYLPNGEHNPNAQHNIENSNIRGFETDVYMNFCAGKDAATQVRDMLLWLPSNLVKSGE